MSWNMLVGMRDVNHNFNPSLAAAQQQAAQEHYLEVNSQNRSIHGLCCCD